jgi:serine protein kinase
MNYIGGLSLDGKKFDYRTNERLQKAWSSSCSGPKIRSNSQPGLQRRRWDAGKIDIVKAR